MLSSAVKYVIDELVVKYDMDVDHYMILIFMHIDVNLKLFNNYLPDILLS